ncbi:MAG: CoA pyrophosphatase [Gemmatimonadota bacterium]|nr:CoA pyrophosphatase [Gemmatimonadota bacterium]MDE3128606.1 CoA pyrophosphatase [Gemmatimonadota bacterium]MDE3174203.1 CoA pyrophosphatase [Gemmatimonadota bacterium]MDE3216924.1 CoA pyrophosphatase [Gemmatimonadota bacterium]
MTPLDDFLEHPDILRLARALAARPGRTVEPDRPVRYAATAATLRPGVSGPELLLIRRAQADRDPWSGHVAWPGGRMEPGDADLAATAVRETFEETGIDLARRGRLLGTLDDIHPRTPALPPILVRPFVAAVAAGAAVTPSREVAGFGWVPMAALLDEANWGTAPVTIRTVGVEERPVFRYGEFQVWGMTERMLRQLVDLLRDAG